MSFDTLPTPRATAASQTTEPLRRKPVSKPASSLYRVIWRWHFYAGVFVTPVLLVVALTGGIYLFAAEINDADQSEFVFAEPASDAKPRSESASASVLVANAQASVPNGRAVQIRHPADKSRNAIVWVTPPADGESAKPKGRRNKEIAVYVDPSSGEVRHQTSGQSSLETFLGTVLKLHRNLLAGTTGRIVVELATCWTLVLFLTGIYLWWPRCKEKVRGVWLPRLRGKPYVVLRDLHTLAGVYLFPVCLLLIVTGLFYTLIWGESFHLVSKQFFATPVEETEQRAGKSETSQEPESYTQPAFGLQVAFDKATLRYPDRDITIELPKGSTDHYSVSAINDYARATYGAMNSTGFQIHRDTGEIMAIEDLADNPRYWWHTWAYPLHVGSVLGLFSKIVWLAACLIFVALPITGIWMWWKRRPAGRSGVPRKLPNGSVTKTVFASIALLCFLMPLFGLSVLLILILDRIISLIHRLKTAG